MASHRPDLGNVRVLVVEDDESLRDFLNLSLGYVGAAVTATANLHEGLAVLDTLQPDVIVFNLAVDDAGLPLAQAAQDRDIPAIGLTARLRDPAVDVLLRTHGVRLVDEFDHQAVVLAVEDAVKMA
jgi:DNA-binding response OmpR family regulator